MSQPDTGEQALEIAETLVRSNAVDVIVVDSVAALVPRAEIEGEMGDSHMGLQARLMSQALRKLSGAERLILRLAAYTAQLGAPVTLVTHYFDASCALLLFWRGPINTRHAKARMNSCP